MPWWGIARSVSRPAWMTTSPSPSARRRCSWPSPGGCRPGPCRPWLVEPEMTRSAALLEDATAIRMALQRLCAAGERLEVTYRSQRAAYPILTEDGERLAFRMPFDAIAAWGLKPGEHLALKLKDRGLEYECVVAQAGQEVLEGVEACLAILPRVLRSSDLPGLG